MSLKSFAFPHKSRLTEKDSFTNVFAKTAYAKRTQFYSVFATRGAQSQARLGIVVAKRNIKLAVMRNKLKRLIRESFRQQQEQLTGLDVVVVVKKSFDLFNFGPGLTIDGLTEKCSPE